MVARHIGEISLGWHPGSWILNIEMLKRVIKSVATNRCRKRSRNRIHRVEECVCQGHLDPERQDTEIARFPEQSSSSVS